MWWLGTSPCRSWAPTTRPHQDRMRGHYLFSVSSLCCTASHCLPSPAQRGDNALVSTAIPPLGQVGGVDSWREYFISPIEKQALDPWTSLPPTLTLHFTDVPNCVQMSSLSTHLGSTQNKVLKKNSNCFDPHSPSFLLLFIWSLDPLELFLHILSIR